MGELALVREAGCSGDLRQGQVRPCLQELLGPLDAAQDDVLVRRQPGGRLELPGEVVGAEADNRGHLRQGRAAVEVFLDVLDDGAEPPPRQHPVPPALRPAGRQDVADQVDGQDVGQRLGGQPPRRRRRPSVRRPPPTSRPGVGEVQAVERRDRQPRRVEVERLGGDPRDQPRLQVEVQRRPCIRSSAPEPGCRPAPARSIRRGAARAASPLRTAGPSSTSCGRVGGFAEPVVQECSAHGLPRKGFGPNVSRSCGKLGRGFIALAKARDEHGHASLVRAIDVAEVAHEVAFLDEGGDGHIERQRAGE